MTVICWDGKTLAADSQSTADSGLIATGCKIWESDGVLFAATGSRGEGKYLMDWYLKGAEFDKYPVLPGPYDIDTSLIVIGRDGISVYYQTPIPCKFDIESKLAWGSGAQSAMGAMECGASAREACEAACRVNAYCGMPVHSMVLGDDKIRVSV